MNTKKLFFGLMAFAFFAMATVATTVVDVDGQTKTELKKSVIKM